MGEGDFVGMRDPDEVAKIAAANALESIDLNKKEIAEIIVFLNALTDPQSLKSALGIPSSVPSGLPLDESVKVSKASPERIICKPWFGFDLAHSLCAPSGQIIRNDMRSA